MKSEEREITTIEGVTLIQTPCGVTLKDDLHHRVDMSLEGAQALAEWILDLQGYTKYERD